LEREEVKVSRQDIVDLFDKKRVQATTIALDIDNLILDEPMDHPKSTMVRPLDMLHLENIKNLLLERPENFVTPFVLVVDPEDCPDVDSWDPDQMSNWKYRVIGGNHGARAKQQLWDSYQRKVHRRIEAWVFAGLTRSEVHTLGWTHNIDQQ
jgi:hypothetical protein